MLPFTAAARVALNHPARALIAGRHAHAPAGLLLRPATTGRAVFSSASTPSRLAYNPRASSTWFKSACTTSLPLTRGFAAGTARCGALSRAGLHGSGRAVGGAGRAATARVGRAGEGGW